MKNHSLENKAILAKETRKAEVVHEKPVPERVKRTYPTAWLLFLIFFMVVIYSVPVVQTLDDIITSYKARKENPNIPLRVQMFDILEDTFITPLHKANSIHKYLTSAKSTLANVKSELNKVVVNDSIPWDYSNVKTLVDDAVFSIIDAKKAAYQINRHVTADSTKPQFVKFDTAKGFVSSIAEAIDNGEDLESIKKRASEADNQLGSILNEYPQRSIIDVPYLVGKVFFYIYWGDIYLRPYEEDMKDKSVFANTIRPKMLLNWYSWLEDLGDKGVLGRDGWFFYKPDVDFLIRPYILDHRSAVVDPNDKPIKDNAIDTIVYFKNQLAKMGIDLLVVVVPVKASIYPEMLNKSMDPSLAGTFSHSLQSMKELNAKGVETIDLFKAFAEERKNDKLHGDSLYLQKDTHWKGRAVRLAAHLVAERIKQYSWYTLDSTNMVKYVIDTVYADRIGDIGKMTTLPDMKIRQLQLSFAPEKAKCYKVFQIVQDSLGNEIERTPYRDSKRGSQVLLLGDSFSRIFQTDEPGSAGWISHIAYELSQPIASIVSDGGASTRVRETLAKNVKQLKGKKLVVWEFVERDWRYGEGGWKNIDLSGK